MQDNDESKGENKDQNGTIVGLLFRCEIWSPRFKDEHFLQVSDRQLPCSISVTDVRCSKVFRMLVSVNNGCAAFAGKGESSGHVCGRCGSGIEMAQNHV